jgi:hypothetical protein
MRYFLPMIRISFARATVSAGELAIRRLAALRLGDRRTLPPINWLRLHIRRVMHETETLVQLSWAAMAHRMSQKWTDFRSLSALEQGCWAFLGAVSMVCLALRVLYR